MKAKIPIRWLVVSVTAAVLPFAFPGEFARGLLVQFLIFAILAIGLNMLFGQTGHLPFGFGAFWGLGAYGSTLVTLRLGWPFGAAIVVGALVASLAGLILGWVTLRLKGPYFAIASYAFMFIVYLIVKNWIDFTGGPLGLVGIPRPSVGSFVFATNLSYYFLALVVLLFCLYLQNCISRSPVGRATVATGENEDLAQSIGISIFKYQVWCLSISALMGGLAGALYAHYYRVILPDVISSYYSLVAIAIVIVGGQGKLFGPLLGAAIFVILPESFGLTGPARMIAFGLITIACAMGLPGGLLPTLTMVVERIRAAVSASRRQPATQS